MLEAVRLRHSGILGMCAFVNAYPYDVPDFVPGVFLKLGEHLNDPEPIPVSFKNLFFITICINSLNTKSYY